MKKIQAIKTKVDLTITTVNIDPASEQADALAEILWAQICEVDGVFLGANQLGYMERMCFLDVSLAGKRHKGVVCNLDVSIGQDENGVNYEPLQEKAVRIFNSADKRMLVPIYPKLNVTFQEVGTGKETKCTSENTSSNLILYGGEIILNGAIEWVAWDFGTLKNTEKKVGRNDPCACGSGMKFKRCCGG